MNYNIFYFEITFLWCINELYKINIQKSNFKKIIVLSCFIQKLQNYFFRIYILYGTKLRTRNSADTFYENERQHQSVCLTKQIIWFAQILDFTIPVIHKIKRHDLQMRLKINVCLFYHIRNVFISFNIFWNFEGSNPTLYTRGIMHLLCHFW